ncbi:hypothetical protein HG536_0H00540 [Torulaspora globosa]|uniref:N-acetylglucosaminylphosphatidylinositol deacetylase n=1 Tax=Torulaspora globosa TaxID=48254 RepID=A0A7G3ZME3_9SACH|nr:uncharacterized protein HG536_0H00540 [Torulaspora globosa]QLL34679.1 hypothetical protein HG536_0H00540 [Torulaspora globosa]
MNISAASVKIVKLILLAWLLFVVSTARIAARNSLQWSRHLNVATEQVDSITLIIAHPDDEVMFFAPTLLQLDHLLPESVQFNFVCLSKGDADSLGPIRERELRKSARLLMGRSGRGFEVFQHDFPDGFDETWDVRSVASSIEDSVFIDGRAPRTVLVTFDEHGVSGHPNHVACHRAVKHIVAQRPGVQALLLKSHHGNIVLKYCGFVYDVLKLYFETFLERSDSGLSFVNTFPQYLLAFASMANAHESQLVWYRYGWWSLSRFVFVNDLEVVVQ